MSMDFRGIFPGRFFRGIGNAFRRFAFLVMAGWATLAVYYSDLPPFFRPVIAGLFAVGSLAVLTVGYRLRGARLVFMAAFTVVLVWWRQIPPSQTTNWQPDVVLLPWAAIDGERVTIRHRNVDYRTETDYTVRHYDRTFDLTRMKKR
jgi:hypothetical protein